jgi:uncharacterized protein (DUF885 family)
LDVPTEDLKSIASILAAGYLRHRDQLRRALEIANHADLLILAPKTKFGEGVARRPDSGCSLSMNSTKVILGGRGFPMNDRGGGTRRGFLSGCAAVAETAWAASPDAPFIDAANDYIRMFLANSPVQATAIGEHRYDGRLNDWSASGRERTLVIHQDFLKRLETIAPEKLQLQNRIDYQIVRLRAQAAIWNQNVLREFEWNPMLYNPGNSFNLLLEREFAPLADRLESLRSRLDALPEFLAAAKTNLKNPPRIFTETAISQNKGVISLVRKQASERAANVPGLKDKLAVSQERAGAALEDWGRWLEKDLLPRSDRDFRLGPELFKAKLRYTLDSALSPVEMRKRAQAELEKARRAIYETAVVLLRKWTPGGDVTDKNKAVRTVLDRLAEQRPSASNVIAKGEAVVQEATEFVRSRGLVSVPVTPLQVVPMPEFQRGVAVASCATPGALEKHGQTFLNISPPPEGWNAAQVDSYFREYNDFMLKDLIVHEAMPGHYLQRAHANQFSAPTPIRGVFSSGAFTEGWAVYAERVMADHDFGGAEVRMQQLKMWLRAIINTLLDVGIHTEGMTEQQAMDLMMNEGYQERSEAAGKWRRASLSSTQLCTYFAGATELLQFRGDYERRHGRIRDWKAFHDRMLSFGSPAPRYLSQLMM